MLGLELCLEERALELPSLGIGDTPKVSVDKGLFVGWERVLLDPPLRDLEALTIVGRLEVCGQESLELSV